MKTYVIGLLIGTYKNVHFPEILTKNHGILPTIWIYPGDLKNYVTQNKFNTIGLYTDKYICVCLFCIVFSMKSSRPHCRPEFLTHLSIKEETVMKEKEIIRVH